MGVWQLTLILSTSVVVASRVQQVQHNDANTSFLPQERCCCRTDKVAGQEILRCQTFEQKDLTLYMFCPAISGWFSSSSIWGNDEKGPCNISWTLGTTAQACHGKTKHCQCAETVDAELHTERVKGTVFSGMKRNVAAFWSVPYASYPGRWQHPTALPKTKMNHQSKDATDHCSTPFLHQLRTGAQDSSHRGSFCFQWLPALGRFGTESCLTLDVYTPAVVQLPAGLEPSYYRLVEAKLPVMVFIEGGGFLVGDKYQSGIYDGRKLVEKQNVILVNINYRLGVLGFLNHPFLTDKESDEQLMNFGLRDQLEALRWIQENIASFGGDPNQVTLTGQSAGAMSICAHLASPVARQFFSSVILDSTNCDGFFIWQPHSFAQDWGIRYIRGVMGRIRGCGTLPEKQLKVYKESQNGCSPSDTASLESLFDRCFDLFLGLDVDTNAVNMSYFAEMLPLEWDGGCDGTYRGCTPRTLPSGHIWDDALLRCAFRLDVGHVWVNQFGITTRHQTEKASVIEELMGMAFSGMPLPPHLPWAPVVMPRGPKEMHYASGGGIMTLPEKAIMEDTSELNLHSITAGFNRDEGTLFALLVPHFLGDVPKFTKNPGMEDQEYRAILEQLVCPDYGPACTKDGCHTDPDCHSRLERILKEYDGDSRPSLARGSCCSKDPNTMRLQRILTDYLFVCPTLRFLDTMKQRTPKSALRLYEFDADDELPSRIPDLKNTLGAFHFSELFFLFGNEEGPGGNLPMQGGALGFGLGFSKQDVVISKKMSESWGHLLRHEEVPEWPNLTSNLATRFALNVPGNVDHLSKGMIHRLHHCEFFDALKLDIEKDLKPF